MVEYNIERVSNIIAGQNDYTTHRATHQAEELPVLSATKLYYQLQRTISFVA